MVALLTPPRESFEERLDRPDRLSLSLTRWPSSRGRGVVFAHGFGQTRHAWRASAAAVAANGFGCVAFDARGHGASDWRGAAPYDFEAMAADLAAVAATAGFRPVLVGASMGGLLGIAAQARLDSPFGAMVLVDVTPRWETRGVERILGFMRAHPDGFASREEAVAVIAAYLPQRGGRRSPQRLDALLVDRGDGRLRWHWDPRLLDDLTVDVERHQPMLLDAVRRIEVPLLLVSGGRSDIVSDATIAEFLALAPHARHVVVPDATHMVAGDDNHAFTRHVLEFLHALPTEDPPT
ncbi:MAG: alpha/beta hydrolase [Xanthomonadales bacterium]|nr:alpha/beta hydrolase [Xanthomonadales bacterium]